MVEAVMTHVFVFRDRKGKVTDEVRYRDGDPAIEFHAEKMDIEYHAVVEFSDEQM